MSHILPMLSEDFLWTEFHNILKEFNKEHVLETANALANLRNISQESSDEVVRESIRDLGLNLPNEVLDLNLPKLREFFYHLPNFEENLGNPKYQEFISFILDSGFEVIPLWTADFKTFSEKPQGTLLEDGGSWYKTSHVKILPEWGKLQNAFDLTIDPELERALIKDGILDSGTNNVGKDASDISPLVVQAVLEYKVIDFFYRFAPIELVLERLIFTVKAKGGLYLSGHAGYFNKDYADYTKAKLIKVVFPRPKRIRATSPVELFGTAHYDDNSQKLVPIRVEIIQGKEYLDKQLPSKVIFKDPKQNVPLKLKFHAEGRSSEHVTLLMTSADVISPKFIEIPLKSAINENNQYPLRLLGMFDTLQLVEDIDQVEWYADSPNVKIVEGVLYAGRIHKDEEFTLVAEYWDGNNKFHSVEKKIQLIDAFKERVPVGLEIIGVDKITQGNTGQLTCEVLYSDDSRVGIIPQWGCKNPSVTVSPTGLVHSVKVQSDFKSSIHATITVDGVTLSSTKLVEFIYERLVIYKTEIIGSDSMLESSFQQLYCTASWCFVEDYEKLQRGEVTEDQIERNTTRVSARWALGNGTTSNADLDNGQLTTHSTNSKSSVVVIANVTQRGGNPISATKFITVNPKEDYISHLDLICSPDIHQGNVYPIKVVGVFDSGNTKDFSVDPRATVALDIKTDEDLPNHRASLYLIDDKIYFTGDVSGLAKLNCVVDYQHTLAEGGEETQTVQQDKLLSIIPKVVKTDSMEVLAPETNILEQGMWVIQEESRMFLNTVVTFEDGTSQSVKPNWLNELVIPDETELESPIDLVNMDITLGNMVEVLTGYSKEQAYMVAARHIYGHVDSELDGNTLNWYDKNGNPFSLDLSEATDWSIISNLEELSGYIEFKTVSTQSDFDVELTRTLVQCRKVLEDTELVFKATYFKEEFESEVIVVDREEVNPDKVLSSAIRGPKEFLANVESVSYALYVNFDDGGVEYAVSNDWSLRVLNKRAVIESLGWETVESDIELDLKYPDNLIMDIDQDGYVYPKENATVDFEVTAHYDDSYDQFERTFKAQSIRANLQLQGIEIIGFDTMLDLNDPNLVYDDGTPHFPFIARVQHKDGTSENVKADWKIRIDPSVAGGNPDGISVDPSTGKFYVSEQIVDQHIILEVFYEKQYDFHLEEVKAYLPVQVTATRAVESIEIVGPASTVDSTTVQLKANVTRRDGSIEDMTDFCEWYILDGNNAVTLDKGLADIGKFATDKQVYVGAKLQQDTKSFEATFDFSVTGQSALNGLSISGLEDVRDDSKLQLEAILFRGTEPVQDIDQVDCEVQECVTHKCNWEVVSGLDIASVLGGSLVIKPTTVTKRIEIKATYTEKGVTVEDVTSILVNSSMPRYGVAPIGLTLPELLEYETVDSPDRGGSFAINVDSKDSTTVFGYFCHRKDLGKAYIVESKGRLGFGGWDGASWSDTHHNYSTPEELQDILDNVGSGPVEFDIVYGNVTTTYLLYRTNKNNFGVGEFAYYYTDRNN